MRKIKEAEAEALSTALYVSLLFIILRVIYELPSAFCRGFGPSKPGVPGSNPTVTSTGASGSNSIPVPVRGKPAETEEEKEERRLRKAEKKAKKEERRIRRAERASRRARREHRDGREGRRSRSWSKDRSSRSRSPARRARDRSRRTRSRSRTPPRRGDYVERERDRSRRWDESPRR